jgi:hypothetical protein
MSSLNKKRVFGLLLAGAMVSFPCLPAIAGRAQDRRVTAAIKRGTAALVPLLEELLEKPQGRYAMGKIGLALTALLESGLPTDAEVVPRALETLETLPFQVTYSIACYLFALDAYWQARHRAWKLESVAPDSKTIVVDTDVPRLPPDGPVREKMEKLVGWLVSGKGGAWTYKGRVEGGDLSNAQFAMLGLKIGLQNRIDVPIEVFQAVAERLASSQFITRSRSRFVIVYRTRAWEGVTEGRTRPRRYRGATGGWNYSYAPRGPITSNMTAAGLSSLLIARAGLKKQGAYPEELAAKVDASIDAALGWMALNIERYFGNDLYGLYSLEKVGDIASIARFGKVDWYAKGAGRLLGLQTRQGTWDGGRGTLVGTSLALLFLTRATQSPLQVLGPPVFTRGEKGYEGDSGLVYLPQQNGFVSGKVFFEFLAETRDPKVLPMAADAVKSYPPHLVHELLAYMLELWTKKKDPVTRFAAEQAATLTGLRKIRRKECVILTQQLASVRDMDLSGEVEGDRVSDLLEKTRSPVLKRRLLELIDRLGQVDTFDAVVTTLGDRDPKVAERAGEILSTWATQYESIAGGKISPASEDVNGRKRAWTDWWRLHKGEILAAWNLQRRVGRLLRNGGGEAAKDAGETVFQDVVDLGLEAVPALLAALEKSEYSMDHIRALEAITGESLGIRAAAWRSWWEESGRR